MSSEVCTTHAWRFVGENRAEDVMWCSRCGALGFLYRGVARDIELPESATRPETLIDEYGDTGVVQ